MTPNQEATFEASLLQIAAALERVANDLLKSKDVETAIADAGLFNALQGRFDAYASSTTLEAREIGPLAFGVCTNLQVCVR